MYNDNYEVVWGGDPGESGIWYHNRMIISTWELSNRFDLTAVKVAAFSQKQLQNLVNRYERQNADERKRMNRS